MMATALARLGASAERAGCARSLAAELGRCSRRCQGRSRRPAPRAGGSLSCRTRTATSSTRRSRGSASSSSSRSSPPRSARTSRRAVTGTSSSRAAAPIARACPRRREPVPRHRAGGRARAAHHLGQPARRGGRAAAGRRAATVSPGSPKASIRSCREHPAGDERGRCRQSPSCSERRRGAARPPLAARRGRVPRLVADDCLQDEHLALEEDGCSWPPRRAGHGDRGTPEAPSTHRTGPGLGTQLVELAEARMTEEGGADPLLGVRGGRESRGAVRAARLSRSAALLGNGDRARRGAVGPAVPAELFREDEALNSTCDRGGVRRPLGPIRSPSRSGGRGSVPARTTTPRSGSSSVTATRSRPSPATRFAPAVATSARWSPARVARPRLRARTAPPHLPRVPPAGHDTRHSRGRRREPHRRRSRLYESVGMHVEQEQIVWEKALP